MNEGYWVVVGGGATGGILSREEADSTSTPHPDRLATGAVVRELNIENGRMNYQRLSGSGPDSGWVAVRLPDKDLLNPVAGLWEVVGGEGKGGILVRAGSETASEASPDRLATGAIVREISTQGGRLQYALLIGDGPPTGWISVQVDGKELLARVPPTPPKPKRYASLKSTDTVVINRKTSAYKGQKPKPSGRPKIRICCLHGGGSTAQSMKFQTVQLKNMLKKEADWFFVDGVFLWDKREEQSHTPRESGEERIRQGAAYRSWFRSEYEPPLRFGWSQREMYFDREVKVFYQDFEETVTKVQQYIDKEGPFDVLFAFSQGCSVATGVAIQYLRQTGAVPWRLSMLFNGMHMRDERYMPESPLPIPCVQVFGRNDHFREYQGGNLVGEYQDPVVIEYDGHHNFPPSDSPQSKEVYTEVAAAMRWHCGLAVS